MVCITTRAPLGMLLKHKTVSTMLLCRGDADGGITPVNERFYSDLSHILVQQAPPRAVWGCNYDGEASALCALRL